MTLPPRTATYFSTTTFMLHGSRVSVSGRLCELIVVVDGGRGLPLAVVTLHDLLRAQAAITDRDG